MNTDRPPPQRGFPEAEFARRLERAQDFMGRATMDALLFTTPEDIRYFSGFLTQFFQSPTRPWFLIVPKAGKPVAVIPTIGEVAMSRTWIEDIRTWSSPHPTDDGISLLAGTLAEFGHRIGLPMGREAALRMPLNDFARLRQRLDGAEFVDASPIIQALRLVKSELEIEKIAYACAAVGDAFDAAMRSIAWEGRLVVIGFASGRVPEAKANILLVKNISVVGFYWGSYNIKKPEVVMDSMKTLLQWYDAGKIKPHVSHQIPMEKAADALEMMIQRKSTGKVVLTLD